MLDAQRGIPDLDLSKTTIRGAALLPHLFCAFYIQATVSPAMTILTIDMSLIRMLSEGPEVSLNGIADD